MQPMSEAAGRDLRWTQPRIGRRWWELRAVRAADGKPHGDDANLYAALGTRTFMQRAAEIETASATWRLHRPRLLSRDLQVLDGGTVVATVRWSGLAWKRTARVECAGGTAFIYWPRRFWAGEYAISREGSEAHIVTFRRRFRWLRTENDVQIAPAAADLPELALLVTLGWYIRVGMIQKQRHVAMAT